jgi:hypothetical protein
MIARAATAMAAALLGNCAQGSPIFQAEAPRICAESVTLFASADSVPSLYREVALITQDAPRQRQDAAAAGANAIILNTTTKTNPANMMGPAIGDPMSRQGKVVAIYIPADTARVARACRPGPSWRSSTSIAGSVSVSRTPHVATAGGSRSRGDNGGEFRSAAPASVSRNRAFDLSGRTSGSASSLRPDREPEDSSILTRNSDVRTALASLKRLNLVTSAEEVRPGLVRLHISGMKPRTQLEYHMSFLHASYQAALPFGHKAIVELWANGTKVGEYTSDGLFLGGGESEAQ